MDGTEVIEIPINESEEDAVDFKTEVVENESEQDISGTGTSILNSFTTGPPTTSQVIFPFFEISMRSFSVRLRILSIHIRNISYRIYGLPESFSFIEFIGS